MAPISTAGKNLYLTSGAPNTVWISLHTADPGDNGANEVATGGRYARQSVTLDAADAGEREATSVPLVPINPGDSVTYAGAWTAETGGTWLGGELLNANGDPITDANNNVDVRVTSWVTKLTNPA